MEHLSRIKPPVKTVTEIPNGLLKHLYRNTSYGRTQNDALTFIRSGSLCLDFFAQAGAMRKKPVEALDLFKAAYAEDRQNALRTLFYLRDIRGGQGERSLFRNCLEWLGTNYPADFVKVLSHVPFYGRWDDILFDNQACFDLIGSQLDQDRDVEHPSLLAKWLPTANASSKTTKHKAQIVYKRLGMKEKEYRILVRSLRAKISTVEEKMSANEWSDIDYSAVPSQAARIYREAFKKHDPVRYQEYVGAAVKGEAKINASTLYPYQIYQSAQKKYDQTLDALWNQLPDYTRGNNALVVADVSGSMQGQPMAVSVSLALYFAERNKGQFKDHFITFSAMPTLQRVVGTTLLDKMNSIERSNWDMNTNLTAVFALLLVTATQHNTPADEMPSTIYIISDMEFDSCVRNETPFEFIKARYAEAGYQMPTVVYWKVNQLSNKNVPVQMNEQGVALVSGFSPSIFKIAVENKDPITVMLETINSERYARIQVD